ncbi:MAG: hypothetical protein HYZ74_03825 [Elusimicrobia bacterium]|nr:hypothetical protein [Elusimicrobiota bacterium]
MRESLDALFQVCASDIWLPEDVYPQYWELARKHGLKPRRFQTLLDADLSELDLAGERSWLLLPHPLVPAGRGLRSAEVDRLARWLRDSPGRVLVLDCVYCLDLPVAGALSALLNSGQAVVLHSLSKGWLSPGLLGAAFLPEAIAAEFEPPSPQALAQARVRLSSLDAPRRIEETLRRRWRRLAPSIQARFPGWTSPETGYFSVLPAASRELLRSHGWLAIPASVFGSPRDDLSVASCLYYGDEAALP